jgi:type IV pilus assembly protein PilA
MVAVAIIGILAAVAIPAFMKYIRKSRTAEARELVKKVYDGARAYYMDPNYAPGSNQPLPAQFPVPGNGSNVLGPTAHSGCCVAGGTTEKCQPQSDLWTDAAWPAIHFSVDEPHYFAYGYTVNNDPGAIDGSNNYVAVAEGDLDCDGAHSTFAMLGYVDSTYADGPAGTANMSRTNELE